MARGTLYLSVTIAAAVLVACSVALLLAVSEEEAGAAFPGKSGMITFDVTASRTGRPTRSSPSSPMGRARGS